MNENNLALENLKSLTLLCVEDNKTTQTLYKVSLEELFFKVHFAYTGEEGYNIFMQESVDIIISNYEIPKLNGLEMLERIREKDKDTPIILVSAIEDVEIFKHSLKLGVNSFISKPFEIEEVLHALQTSSQLLLDRNYIKEQKDKELKSLKDKHKYNSYQEDLAFAKELNILRNDFYYQMIDEKHISLVDFLYQPLDLISGDAYTARRVDEHRTFYLIVDGMGKGLSASLTAMIMTSFINHIIDKMIIYDSFSLDILLKESMDYIKPILLDEESLAIDYILFDTAYNSLSYAKFAMPVILLQDINNNIIRLKSNNPPLSKWQMNYTIDEYDVKDIEKFLFYSDGIVENSTKEIDKVYADYIEEDFKNSYTREDLKTKCFEKIDEIEDDITLIFINRLRLSDTLISKRVFNSTLADMDNAHSWYSELFSEFTPVQDIVEGAGLVFTELYMNAYEHGNLGINASLKHNLLDEDIYFETLAEKEQNCSKKITVSVYKISYASNIYIVTQICDEGSGFDTQSLSEIFRNGTKFNGRGVFISRKNSSGIYYSSKGSSVLYLNKI
jgi:CheY-like chemotaxis protein